MAKLTELEKDLRRPAARNGTASCQRKLSPPRVVEEEARPSPEPLRRASRGSGAPVEQDPRSAHLGVVDFSPLHAFEEDPEAGPKRPHVGVLADVIIALNRIDRQPLVEALRELATTPSDELRDLLVRLAAGCMHEAVKLDGGIAADDLALELHATAHGVFDPTNFTR